MCLRAGELKSDVQSCGGGFRRRRRRSSSVSRHQSFDESQSVKFGSKFICGRRRVLFDLSLLHKY